MLGFVLPGVDMYVAQNARSERVANHVDPGSHEIKRSQHARTPIALLTEA